jgi:hypothetical protein
MVPRRACDVAPHHVHAHAAAGQVGHLLGGGQAGLEDQVEDLAVGKVVAGIHQAALDGLGEDLVAVQAGRRRRPPSMTMLPASW